MNNIINNSNNIINNMDTVAWTTWNDDGPNRASKLHFVDPENAAKTACGRWLPSQETVDYDHDNNEGDCKSCQRKADALHNAQELRRQYELINGWIAVAESEMDAANLDIRKLHEAAPVLADHVVEHAAIYLRSAARNIADRLKELHQDRAVMLTKLQDQDV